MPSWNYAPWDEYDYDWDLDDAYDEISDISYYAQCFVANAKQTDDDNEVTFD